MEQQIEITISVNLNEANVILDSIGLNRLNDVFPLYVKVRTQTEEQIIAIKAEAALKAQEAKPEKK